MTGAVWHLQMERREAPRLDAWIQDGVLQAPAEALPRAGDAVFVHAGRGGTAVGRVVEDATPSAGGEVLARVTWRRVPPLPRMAGTPHGEGLRRVRAYLWGHRKEADKWLQQT